MLLISQSARVLANHKRMSSGSSLTTPTNLLALA